MYVQARLGGVIAPIRDMKEVFARSGLLDYIKLAPEKWRSVFVAGFGETVSADMFLDMCTPDFDDNQLKKQAEITTYKLFCDFIESLDEGNHAKNTSC